jgi:hypothetical protein
MRRYITGFLNIEKINEINTKFRYGRVRMTPGVRLILFLLKLYVFVMGVLLAIKFYQILKGGSA